MKLEDKVAVITGGAQGIGRAIAETFQSEGAQVVAADISAESTQLAPLELSSKADTPSAFSINLDVTNQDSIDSMVSAVVSKLGKIDILVNSAAIFDMAPLLDETPERWDRVFEVNTKGVFFTLQTVARQMVSQGHGGKIVNIASQAGRRGEALVATYCASKAAVISITQSAGLALIEHGINVNAISPGVADTPMWDTADALFAEHEDRPIGEKKRLVGEAVPAGRMAKPEDHAGCALFLVSADSDYVVAQTYNVDGGNWMS